MSPTTEQHRQAAESIAANNKDWTWDGRHLMHKSGALTRLAGYGSRWRAWPPYEGFLKGPGGKASAFHTPAAACRALGFEVTP